MSTFTFGRGLGSPVLGSGCRVGKGYSQEVPTTLGHSVNVAAPTPIRVSRYSELREPKPYSYDSRPDP